MGYLWRGSPYLPIVGAGFFLALALLFSADPALAHDVSRDDASLIARNPGLQIGIYLWLGAKHMVTGYDHLLFLVGVIFYLRGFREIAVLASLFALGHTITLVSGVLFSLSVSPFLVDAIIGLSVAYKGFDNLGGFQKLFGESPDERIAVFLFGLFHGMGLATELQGIGLKPDGLVGNLLAFNAGVEIGQIAALCAIVLALRWLTWGKERSGSRLLVNCGLVVSGFALMTYQLARFYLP